MSAASVLVVRDLHVSFPAKQGQVVALAGVDLEISSGSLFVLLGPNGAGKTTLMRCITGLVPPTRGSVSVLGEHLVAKSKYGGGTISDRSRLARLGVLIENPGLYGRLNAQEYLTFFGAFYQIKDLDVRIRTLCAELDLALDGKRIAKLSQGNRQKLQLVRSLLHSPDFLLWDEPTDHLDPVSQQQVLEYLQRYLRETGATALVATHRLEQMEGAASHFGFIAHGKLIRTGTSEEILVNEEGGERARFGFARPLFADELSGLDAELGVEIFPGPAEALEIRAPDLRSRMPSLIKALVRRDLPLALVEPLRPGLADVYARWIGK